MSFSMRAIIRALLVPEHKLSCSAHLWRTVVRELQRRGGHRHESGVFLLGVERGTRREVKDVVYYDQLNEYAYDSGVCMLHGDAFAKLWGICRKRGLSVVADVHTHPGSARQSALDKTNPMIATAGHIAIIVPDFARRDDVREGLGVYEYLGRHRWSDRSGQSARKYFYTGFWS